MAVIRAKRRKIVCSDPVVLAKHDRAAALCGERWSAWVHKVLGAAADRIIEEHEREMRSRQEVIDRCKELDESL